MSCELFVSFDDYGVVYTARLRGVQGAVDGLRDAKVTLRVRDALIEVGDGPFTFPPTVSEGAAFAVTVVADPAGHNGNYIQNGFGVIATADAQGVMVHCPSTIATLRNRFYLGGSAVPGSSNRGSLDYAAASSLLGPRATTVMATTHDDRARISVKGVTTASGQASAVISRYWPEPHRRHRHRRRRSNANALHGRRVPARH